MNVKVEKTDKKDEVKLTFKVEAEKFNEAIKKVYKENSKYFQVPGFRKGKAPFAIVEKYYGIDMFYQDAFNDLVPPIYEKALEENNIDAISKPEIDIKNMKKDEDLEFVCTVQTKPEIKLTKYKGVEIPKIEHKTTEEDIEHELKHKQEQNARTVKVEDRATKKGDITVIDFEGFVDGKAFEGGKAEKYELELGSNSFIPGFEDQLVGMNVNDEKDINVTFPKEYQAKELAGKDATFKIKLHEIKEKNLPKLDDEFAKDVSEFDTLKELKEDIKKRLDKQNENQTKREIEDAVLDAVAAANKFEVPEVMVHNEIHNMISDFEQQLYYNGLKLEQYMQMTGMTHDKFEEQYHEQAEKNVKAGLIIDQIIKDEKLAATEKEIDDKVKELAEAYGRKFEDVKDQADFRKYAKSTLESQKAMDILVKNAKVK